jgi:hypothetical protein
MTCTSPSGIGCSSQASNCPSENGCINGVCPDFTIRRNDTKPPFKVKMEDCDGPLDLTDLIVEASMWAKGKLKYAMSPTDTYFSLADNIGFPQIMIGDIIIMDRARLPEYMLVTGFDEDDKLVHVQRAYHGTTAQKWSRGTSLRIMKFINSQAQSEMIYQDILQIDGTIESHVLTDSFFVYEWGQYDTCLPGCYYFEFKLIKLKNTPSPAPIDENNYNSDDGSVVFYPSIITTQPSEINLPNIPVVPSVTDVSGQEIIPSFTSPSLIVSDFGCGFGDNIEWIRRFPVAGEGFYIQITDSPTREF